MNGQSDPVLRFSLETARSLFPPLVPVLKIPLPTLNWPPASEIWLQLAMLQVAIERGSEGQRVVLPSPFHPLSSPPPYP